MLINLTAVRTAAFQFCLALRGDRSPYKRRQHGTGDVPALEESDVLLDGVFCSFRWEPLRAKLFELD